MPGSERSSPDSGPERWVVMANLSAHKLAAVRARIEAAGARLLYLSPHSPDSNPIEPSWSKLKSHLRKVAARTTAAMDAAIAEGRRLIGPADAYGCFAHCGYC